MKTSYIYLSAIVLHLIPGFTHGTGMQENNKEAEDYEYYRLCTDRSIYITGEEIHFGIFNLSSDSVRDLQLSTVYYAELISPSGHSYASAKVPLNSIGGEGNLNIPAGLASGTYYLRGYTGYMRNAGAAYFSYLEVMIINPSSAKVLQADSGKGDINLRKPISQAEGITGLSVHTDAASYRTRSPVQAMVNTRGTDDHALLAVSVTRKGTLEKQRYAASKAPVPFSDTMEFIPETQGITLSGKVVGWEDQRPLPYTLVYVSSLNDERDFYCNYTDSHGKFFFSFQEQTGERELFLSAQNPGKDSTKILVDNDFSSSYISLPSRMIDPADSLLAVYNDLSLNAQIFMQYRDRQEEPKKSMQKKRVFFYGDPAYVVHFEDYIKLPNLDEYFRELVPQASIREREGRKYFRMHGSHPDLDIYDPLVMIDGIAMFDADKLLSVSPRYFDRIEIINAPYIRGEVTFGGIINIISKNDDLGYAELPSSGLLINYLMFTKALPVKAVGPATPNVPDVRNTLYWDYGITAKELDSFSFTTNDVPGSYEITIQGFSSQGAYFRTSTEFVVER